MDMEKVSGMEELVKGIKAFELADICFHEEKDAYCTNLVMMQVCELFLACCRDCCTNTVGELLVVAPSDEVRKAMSVEDVRGTKAFAAEVEALREHNVPDGGFFCFRARGRLFRLDCSVRP